MSKGSSSAIEIVATASQLLTDICDIPALSPLKPLGSILVTICAHVIALEENKEAAIMLAERVNRVVRVLINRAPDLDGDMPGNYLGDIKSLEDVLVKIATTLQKSRQRNWFHRMFSPKGDAAQLNCLSSELDHAIQMFGLSADFEARQTFRTVQALISKEANALAPVELPYPMFRPAALRVHRELDMTNNYSIQIGTYDNQAVVVKKYYIRQEERFTQDLRQRQNLIHPGIACIIGGSDKVLIMLLCAEGIVFCTQGVTDIGSVRRPWQQRKIGSKISELDIDIQGTSDPISHSNSGLSQRPPRPVVGNKVSHPQGGSLKREALTIKESKALLQQFIDIMQFLDRMEVGVAWWEFKPSWVGIQGKNRIVLILWDEGTNLKQKGRDFEPRYAIHIMGLGFSDIVPEAFQSERYWNQLHEPALRDHGLHRRTLHNMAHRQGIKLNTTVFKSGPKHQRLWICHLTVTVPNTAPQVFTGEASERLSGVYNRRGGRLGSGLGQEE